MFDHHEHQEKQNSVDVVSRAAETIQQLAEEGRFYDLQPNDF